MSYGAHKSIAMTVPMLADAKREGRKLAMLTAYDAGFARVFDANGVDLILVGDSLGMVVQGHDSTLPVRVEDIVYHTTAVARGAKHALKIADFPFGSDATPEQAHAAAPLRTRHHQALVNRVGHAAGVVRIHDERVGQLVGGSRELAEHEHPILVDPARDEFLADEVHSVA